MQRLWGLICDRGEGGKLFQPVLVPQTEDYDVSTEKCYVKFMLPKRPKNYTKFATNFFNMGLPRPPQWETFGLHVEIAQLFKMCTY